MSFRMISLALAATAALAVPAAAETQTATRGVQYKDLDLSTEAGQKELENRLDTAAREVCGMNERYVGSRVVPRESRECYKDAREQLGAQISKLVKKDAAG
jgi:UrcA family protein